VLFGGSSELQDLLVQKVTEAPAALAPLDAVAEGLDAIAALLQLRGEYPEQRQTVISANAELQERELIKMASLAQATAEALRHRGVTDPAASLTAEAGIAVFKIAFLRWVTNTKQDFAQLMRDSLDELKAVTAAK
jgi:hypothetical protein